jgi:hypothetical protein
VAAGCSRTVSSWGVSQIDRISRTGVSASAPSIAPARAADVRPSIAQAASPVAITIPIARTASGPAAVSAASSNT